MDSNVQWLSEVIFLICCDSDLIVSIADTRKDSDQASRYATSLRHSKSAKLRRWKRNLNCCVLGIRPGWLEASSVVGAKCAIGGIRGESNMLNLPNGKCGHYVHTVYFVVSILQVVTI